MRWWISWNEKVQGESVKMMAATALLTWYGSKSGPWTSMARFRVFIWTLHNSIAGGCNTKKRTENSDPIYCYCHEYKKATLFATACYNHSDWSGLITIVTFSSSLHGISGQRLLVQAFLLIGFHKCTLRATG